MSDLIFKVKSPKKYLDKLPSTHIQNGFCIRKETVQFDKHKYKYIHINENLKRFVSGYYKCEHCNKEILQWSENTPNCSIPKYHYLQKVNVDPVKTLCSQSQLDEAIEKSVKNIRKYIKRVQKIIHVPYSCLQGTTTVASQALSKLLYNKEIELYFLPKSNIEYVKLKENGSK